MRKVYIWVSMVGLSLFGLIFIVVAASGVGDEASERIILGFASIAFAITLVLLEILNQLAEIKEILQANDNSDAANDGGSEEG